MMDTNNVDDFVLKLLTGAEAVVYISLSWQPDGAKDLGYKVVKKLDQKGIIAIGDVKVPSEMESVRIKRIMAQAELFVSILPYRPNTSSKTSSYMLSEIRIAAELLLPVISFSIRGPL